MISTKGKYALRIMINIAISYEKNEVISLKSIIKNDNLPLKYLEQVISLLVRANLLYSVRGNNGGYKLIKNPKEYTVYDILKATEGSVLPVLNIDEDSSISTFTKSFWNEYNNVVLNFLKNKTLESLVLEYKNNNYGLDYCI